MNLYAYVGNDPVNMVDPSGLATVVNLKAYPLGSIPLAGKFGHAYVQYRDTATGEVRISRAGPSQSYPGGASAAVDDHVAPTDRHQYVVCNVIVITDQLRRGYLKPRLSDNILVEGDPGKMLSFHIRGGLIEEHRGRRL